MLCIVSLKIRYDRYITDWFLAHFEGCYCYKDGINIIRWEFIDYILSYTVLVEGDYHFSIINNFAFKNADIFKRIVKKKLA